MRCHLINRRDRDRGDHRGRGDSGGVLFAGHVGFVRWMHAGGFVARVAVIVAVHFELLRRGAVPLVGVVHATEPCRVRGWSRVLAATLEPSRVRPVHPSRRSEERRVGKECA